MRHLMRHSHRVWRRRSPKRSLSFSYERGVSLLEAALGTALIAGALLGLSNVYEDRNQARYEAQEAQHLTVLIERIGVRASVSWDVLSMEAGGALFMNEAALRRAGILRDGDRATFTINGKEVDTIAYFLRNSGAPPFTYHVALVARDAAEWTTADQDRAIAAFARLVKRPGFFQNRPGQDSFRAMDLPHMSPRSETQIVRAGAPPVMDDYIRARGLLSGAILPPPVSDLLILVQGGAGQTLPPADRELEVHIEMQGGHATRRVSSYVTGHEAWMHPIYSPLTFELASRLRDGWTMTSLTSAPGTIDVTTAFTATVCSGTGEKRITVAAPADLHKSLSPMASKARLERKDDWTDPSGERHGFHSFGTSDDTALLEADRHVPRGVFRKWRLNDDPAEKNLADYDALPAALRGRIEERLLEQYGEDSDLRRQRGLDLILQEGARGYKAGALRKAGLFDLLYKDRRHSAGEETALRTYAGAAQFNRDLGGALTATQEIDLTDVDKWGGLHIARPTAVADLRSGTEEEFVKKLFHYDSGIDASVKEKIQRRLTDPAFYNLIQSKIKDIDKNRPDLDSAIYKNAFTQWCKSLAAALKMEDYGFVVEGSGTPSDPPICEAYKNALSSDASYLSAVEGALTVPKRRRDILEKAPEIPQLSFYNGSLVLGRGLPGARELRDHDSGHLRECGADRTGCGATSFLDWAFGTSAGAPASYFPNYLSADVFPMGSIASMSALTMQSSPAGSAGLRLACPLYRALGPFRMSAFAVRSGDESASGSPTAFYRSHFVGNALSHENACIRPGAAPGLSGRAINSQSPMQILFRRFREGATEEFHKQEALASFLTTLRDERWRVTLALDPDIFEKLALEALREDADIDAAVQAGHFGLSKRAPNVRGVRLGGRITESRAVAKPTHSLPVSVNLYQKVALCDHTVAVNAACPNLIDSSISGDHQGSGVYNLLIENPYKGRASHGIGLGGVFQMGHVEVVYDGALATTKTFCVKDLVGS